MPKPSSPSLSLKPRGLRPSAPVPDDIARRLEAAAEAQGNGVAGARDFGAPPSEAVEPAPPAPAPPPPPPRPTVPKKAAKGAAASATIAGAGTLKVPRERKDGVQTRSTSIHLPVDLGRRVKMYCAQNDMRQNEVIIEALEAFLRSNK